MKAWPAILILVAASVAPARPAAGQKEEVPAPGPGPVHVEFRAGTLVKKDRFRNAAGEGQDLWEHRLMLKGYFGLDRFRKGMSVWGGIEENLYDRWFAAAPGLAAGWRLGDRRNSWEAAVYRAWGKPEFLYAGRPETSDELSLWGLYSRRTGEERNHEWAFRGDWSAKDFRLFPIRDQESWEAIASWRYRGFGSRFSPEVGVGYAERNTRVENDQYEQLSALLLIRSSPGRRLYVTFRYRYREREYTIDDPGQSNYGRAEERSNFALTADIHLARRFSLGVYAAREDVDSVLPGSSRAEQTFGASFLTRF